MNRTKEKIESIVAKTEAAGTLEALTAQEYGFFKKYLLKGDTRMVSLHSKYGGGAKKQSPQVKSEVDLDLLGQITPENYTEYELPGITDGTKTRYSGIEKQYLQYFHGRPDITNQMIAFLLKRKVKTIENYMSDLNKKGYTFGTQRSQDMKYYNNARFYKDLRPKTILDAYCGKTSWWKTNCSDLSVVHSNDTNRDVQADTYEPSEYLLWTMVKKHRTFDVVDLDTFGYIGFTELGYALKVATKGLIVTFGDRRGLKNAEFRKNCPTTRINSVKTRYGVDSYNEEDIIREMCDRAVSEFGKKLVVHTRYSYRNIWRVYFKIVDPDIEDLITLYEKKKGELHRLKILISDKYQEQSDKWRKEEEL